MAAVFVKDSGRCITALPSPVKPRSSPAATTLLVINGSVVLLLLIVGLLAWATADVAPELTVRDSRGLRCTGMLHRPYADICIHFASLGALDRD